MNCEHCGKEFKNISALNLHIKTAKYCIRLREGISVVKSEQSNITQQEFGQLKQELVDKDKALGQLRQELIDITQELEHTRQCLYTSDDKLYDALLREQAIWDDYKELASISAKKDTTVINKNKHITNLLSLTPLDLRNITRETVKQKIDDNFTMDHFNNGQKGVAQFAKDHILTDENGKTKYLCTDTARDSYKYLNEYGDIEKDAKAKKLTRLISADVIAKSHQIQQEGRDELDEDIVMARITTHTEICHMRHNNSIFRSELSALTS